MKLRSKLMLALWLALGLCRTSNSQIWERLGPEGGMVISLGATTAGGLYLGTADGHVFFSNDGARSWEIRGRVGTRTDAVVTRLIFDHGTSNRVFAGVWYRSTGAGGGVFRSDDGGRTWTPLGLENEAVRALEIAPSQSGTLVSGTRNGVFRSRDAGQTWERISPPDDPELRNIDSLAIDPGNPELIYAGTYHLPWKTVDGGKSWTLISSGIIDDSDVMSMRIDSTNPARLFMSACSGIYRSENQGAEWVKLQGVPYSARRTQAIVQDLRDPKTLFAGTTEGLWVTRDAGENWVRTTQKDWVVNSVAVVAGNAEIAGRVVVGTENHGVQVSDDAGVHFTAANRGFTHFIVNQLVADPNHAQHLLMLLNRGEDRLVESSNTGASWQPVSLTTVARGNPATLSADQITEIYPSPWGWLLRMEDGKFWLRDERKLVWNAWNPRLAVNVAKGKGTASLRMAGTAVHLQPSGAPSAFTENSAVIPSSFGLLRCASSGVCASLKAYNRGGQVHALWASRNGAQVAAVRDGRLGISHDGGEPVVWREIPVSDGQVHWLDVEQGEGGATVFLGTTSGLYILENAGGPWRQVKGGLPAAPVTHWLRDSTFWVATERDGGMYISTDRGANWQRADREPNVGPFAGLVWGGPGVVLAGSRSEGLLRLVLPSEQGNRKE